MQTERQWDWLDEIVQKTMEFWNIPGLSLAIVQDDRLALSRGFGVRDLEAKLPVTPDTIFAIGSSTKAFTAAATGILVDRGQVNWASAVKDYMPTFQVASSYGSQHLTLLDLLTMRSGLPGYDVIWFGSDGVCPYTRLQLYENLAYMNSTHGPRELFQPHNLLYTVAGMLVGEVSGSDWETFVQNEILNPLGMKDSNFSVETTQESVNFARPYEWNNNDYQRLPFRNVDAIGPAGSINSTVIDMAQWLILNLNDGKYGECQVIESKTLEQLHNPQFVVNSNSTNFARLNPGSTHHISEHIHLLSSISKKFKFPSFNSSIYQNYSQNVDIFSPVCYSLGWLTNAYRGHGLLETSGGIDGFTAMVSMLPNCNLGLVVLTNLNKTMATKSLTYQIYDRFLNLEPLPWNEIFQQEVEEDEKAMEEHWENILAGKQPELKPTHPLEDYLGDFDNPALGLLSVTSEDDKIVATYNNIRYQIEPYCYNTFLAILSPDNKMTNTGSPYPNPVLMSYQTDASGGLPRVSFPIEPALPVLIFERIQES